jgi:hypothetical protein
VVPSITVAAEPTGGEGRRIMEKTRWDEGSASAPKTLSRLRNLFPNGSLRRMLVERWQGDMFPGEGERGGVCGASALMDERDKMKSAVSQYGERQRRDFYC